MKTKTKAPYIITRTHEGDEGLMPCEDGGRCKIARHFWTVNRLDQTTNNYEWVSDHDTKLRAQQARTAYGEANGK